LQGGTPIKRSITNYLRTFLDMIRHQIPVPFQ